MKNIRVITIIVIIGLLVVSCNNRNPFNYDDSDINLLHNSFIENEAMDDILLNRSEDSIINNLENGEDWGINDLRSGFNPKNGYTGTDDSTNVSIDP